MSARVLIIEDSQLMAETLSDLLKANHKQIDLLGIASDGLSGVKLIRSLKPDLVFLDVEMPGINGFEMLSQLSQIDFQIIFVTSYSKYAISAIRFNALDYLLKPIDPKLLSEALVRFEKSHDSRVKQLRIEQALRNFEKEEISEQIFSLATQEGELNILLKEILRIEGDRNYSRIIMSSGKTILSSKNLKYFEERLEDKGFIRCHRSHLVNLIHVLNMSADKFEMTQGMAIRISRSKKNEAKERFLSSTLNKRID